MINERFSIYEYFSLEISFKFIIFIKIILTIFNIDILNNYIVLILILWSFRIINDKIKIKSIKKFNNIYLLLLSKR